MIAAITNRDLAAVIFILAFFLCFAAYIIIDIGAHIRAQQTGTRTDNAISLRVDGSVERTVLGAGDSLGDAA